MFKGKLRTKFLLSLALISASLTWATLLIVRHRVEVRVREQIAEVLHNSVVTFQSLERQRASTLGKSAALLASLPPLKAVMTSQHAATIQDASTDFWHLIGSQLLVLADRSGKVVALHTATSGFALSEAQGQLQSSLAKGEARDWWFGNGHLFEIFLQPIHSGSADDETEIGILAVGYEIDRSVAEDVSRVASSEVAFRYGDTIVISTVPESQRGDLARHAVKFATGDSIPKEVQLGTERFLATTVALSRGRSPEVSLTVLKSYDEATAFLNNLNRWILGVGIAAVLAGSVLIFLISTTFTRPLDSLVQGVHALEEGNFEFPLEARGNDEVSVVTAAFQRMRLTLQDAQRKLLDAERLATIGRMASTISHDLRHPLTAILAYAEFLSEGNLSADQREDFYREIRLAVTRMTDEINQLLGFSKQREALRPSYSGIAEIVERAVQTVQILPEFQNIVITYSHEGDSSAWIDAGKIERVILNLLFNACEAVAPDSGRIEVCSRATDQGLEIEVADNGSGIPEPIRGNLFQPFVSHGKEKGTGLGLTVVQKLTRDHGGDVSVESTGPGGSVFKVFFPPAKTAVKVTQGSDPAL